MLTSICSCRLSSALPLGGNQRDVDRQRSQKRAEKTGAGSGSKKKKGSGNASQALTNKKEHDAEIMRQKQLKAEEKAKSNDLSSGTNSQKRPGK